MWYSKVAIKVKLFLRFSFLFLFCVQETTKPIKQNGVRQNVLKKILKFFKGKVELLIKAFWAYLLLLLFLKRHEISFKTNFSKNKIYLK